MWNSNGDSAAVREAQRRGADDVIFVSSDGMLLEGPTSTLVIRRGDELATPPDAWGGRAGADWARRLAARERFDPSAAALVTVAEVLDRIYGR